VIRKEKEARGRLEAEKQKVLALELRGQRGLAQDFKRTREVSDVFVGVFCVCLYVCVYVCRGE
jgi:hypothetical protein